MVKLSEYFEYKGEFGSWLYATKNQISQYLVEVTQ